MRVAVIAITVNTIGVVATALGLGVNSSCKTSRLCFRART